MGVFEGAFYYVCPKCGIYSGEMDLVRINKTYTVDELYKLEGNTQLAGERLQCPKCKKVYGWHQLKRLQWKGILLEKG